MKVGVIGGGAAGFFAAIQVKENFPESEVVLLEKTSKLLSKVKISGGGRCNVTNDTTSIAELTKAYPRGGKFLKNHLAKFSTKDIRAWFESKGVELYAQEDKRVFPVSDNSQTIIDCFMTETERLNIEIKTGANIQRIEPLDEGIRLWFDAENSVVYDRVIVATGGSPKLSGLQWLADLGHEIEPPVPSLFTFNMPKEKVKELMGVSMEKVSTRIQGEKLSAEGPLLITHWGMSGPAVLLLSAFGARTLAEKNYQFVLQVNWVNEQNQELVRADLQKIIQEHGQKQLQNIRPFEIPSRLWMYFLERIELSPTQKWDEIGKRGLHKLIEALTNDVYQVAGKTTFKEEFVTCGGVSLSSVNKKTLESKVVPGLFFTGEVLDIDGVTGGFNFQAAWTTAYIAGKLGF